MSHINSQGIHNRLGKAENDTLLFDFAQKAVNVIYIRTPKTGSSFICGIVRQIGRNYGMNGWNHNRWAGSHEPFIWAEHGKTAMIRDQLYNVKQPYFTFTFMRDPLERCMSHIYFFRISRGGEEESDDGKIAAMKSDCQDKQFDYLTFLQGQEEPKDLYDNHYDFVGITERIDESLVVMKNMLNLTFCDIMTIGEVKSTQVANAKDEFGAPLRQHNSFKNESAALKSWVKENFRKMSSLDYTMYEYSIQKLDTAIEKIGFNVVLQDVVQYHKLKDKLYSKCRRSHQIDEDKECIFSDQACYYRCIEKQCPPLLDNNIFI